jgi:hypothetical protein
MNSRLTKRESVCLAVYSLGGGSRAVDIEDVAVRAAELTPEFFRWRRYPEQIDLEKVRLCAKNLLVGSSAWLSGSVRNGWMLTPAGVAWCKRYATHETAPTTADLEAKAATAALKRTAAFQKFTSGAAAAIDVHDVRGFLRVDEYTSSRRRRERIQFAENAAAGDRRLVNLIEHLKQNFSGEWL